MFMLWFIVAEFLKKAHTCRKVHLFKQIHFLSVIVMHELNIFLVSIMAYFGDFDCLHLPWHEFVEA
jgi:hypothetical protein